MMTYNQTLALLCLVAALIIVSVVNLNIWYYKKRARMTPEEKARLDDELRGNPGDW